jgi:hypothetical protein
MSERRYRVIQWATGHVGGAALRHFIANPAFELVGVLVTNPEKVGKDAGELVGLPSCGVRATDDVEAILAMEADCVHFSPAWTDVATVCRLLRAGKNVVSAPGPFYPTERYAADFAELAAACAEGGTTFHGSGIHPGFAGDLLPLSLVRIMDRVDHIELFEIVDHLANPSRWLEFMGFGRECADVIANPPRGPEAPHIFAQSMAMVAEALGSSIERLTTSHEVAAATRDIDYGQGIIRAGTVAGQHFAWTGWAEGAPLITYHSYWTMGREHLEPVWNVGDPGYRLRISGNPPMELTIGRPEALEGDVRYISLWTAMAGLTAIPAVCAAPPGVVTHRELGLVEPKGLIRR